MHFSLYSSDIHEQIRASSAPGSSMRDSWTVQDHRSTTSWSLGRSPSVCATGHSDTAQPFHPPAKAGFCLTGPTAPFASI